MNPEGYIYIMGPNSQKVYNDLQYTKREQIIGFVREYGLKRLTNVTDFDQIFYLAHNSSLGGGHLGEKKTMSKIVGEYFFKGISEAIKRKIKPCVPCRKSGPIKGKKPTIPIISSSPL